METPASFIFSIKASHFEIERVSPTVSKGFLILIAAIKSDTLFVILVTVAVTKSATGIRADFISFIFSLNVLNNFTNAPFCSTNGDINKAPILANAALTFDNEPVNVSLAFLACSPKA